MAVPKLEFLSQLAAAKLFWPSPSSTPQSLPTFIIELEKILKKAELKLDNQIQWWLLNGLIRQGLKKIRRIHIEFEAWNKYVLFIPHVNLSFYDPISEYFMTNFLTSDGKFDDYKLVKKLVNDNNCHPRLRFTLACGYFMEDRIRQLWNEWHFYRRILNRNPYNPYKHSVDFWRHRMMDPVDNPEIWQEEFKYQVSYGVQPAQVYLWNKLTPQQQSLYIDDMDQMALYIVQYEKATPFLFSLLTVKKLCIVIERCYTSQYESFLIFIAHGLVDVHCDNEFFQCLLKMFDLKIYWDLLYTMCKQEIYYRSLLRLSCPEAYFNAVRFVWKNLINDIDGCNSYRVDNALKSWKKFERWNCYSMVVKDIDRWLSKT